MIEAWNKALTYLAERVSPEEHRRWFKPLRPAAAAQPGKVLLVAPNRFFIDWLKDHYLNLLEAALSEALGESLGVVLATPDDDLVEALPHSALQARVFPRSEINPHLEAGLNPHYVFNNFVVGESNRFAHAAAFAASNLPGQTYNPLFIYSGAGLGKTHLMNAVGNHFISIKSDVRVVYVSCEDFTNQMIQAIRDKTMDRFRERYRKVDLLLLDDVQFLGNKERTQEEFFFTFNSLYESGRQIVLTSDKKPKDIPGLEERLVSRFEWGLIADIQTPDTETKAAIIHKKAEEEGLDLSEEVVYRLVSTDESNIRVLEGYLVRVAAYASMTSQPITLGLTNLVLRDALAQREISVEDILRLISLRYNVRLVDLRSSKKYKAVAEPRQVAMYLARKMTAHSLVQIGQKFGGKDHSTVVHAVNKIKSRLTKDIEFRRELELLERSIRENQ